MGREDKTRWYYVSTILLNGYFKLAFIYLSYVNENIPSNIPSAKQLQIYNHSSNFIYMKIHISRERLIFKVVVFKLKSSSQMYFEGFFKSLQSRELPDDSRDFAPIFLNRMLKAFL